MKRLKGAWVRHCCLDKKFSMCLTLFDMGAMMPPPPKKMFWSTVPKPVGGGSWNLMTFNINLWSIKSYFWFSRLSSVTIATSLSGSTRNFLKLSFHMFPYNEIWLDIWNKHPEIPLNNCPKIPLNTKFQSNQWRGLGVTSIWNLGLCIG